MHIIKIKKSLIVVFFSINLIYLLNCCSAGNNSNGAMDNLTADWIAIGEKPAAINSMSINTKYNSLAVLTAINNIHTYDILKNSWSDIESIPNNNIVSLTATNDSIYVGLNNGRVMSHNFINNNQMNQNQTDNQWVNVGKNIDKSPVTSIIKSLTNLFIGNESGNIFWFNNDQWQKISTHSSPKAINQLKTDYSNRFLGILNANGEVWLCKIDNNKWINLIKKLKDGGYYTDTSPIKTIAIYSNNNTVYGYWGNENGNIWRVIINDISNPTTAGFSVLNLSDSRNFPGYSNSKMVSALLVNNNSNDLYVATQDGSLWLLEIKDKHWHNLNNNNSKEAITSIVMPKNNILYVGNNMGKIWQVNVSGFSSN